MEKDRKKDIFFKPLSEGLGFHPFSEGMPYAPIPSKKQSLTGSGATAAGPARSSLAGTAKAPQRKEAPKGMVGSNLNSVQAQPPVLRTSAVPSTAPQTRWIPNSVRIGPAAEKKIEPHFTPRTQPNAPQFEQPRPLPQQLIPQTVGRGILFRRGASFLIDLTLSWILFFGALVFYIVKVNAAFDPLANMRVISILLGGGFGFHWGLVTLEELAFRTSFGKRVLGLRLRGGRFRIFLRAILFIPSLGFLMLGLLFGFFQEKRRCFHDWISGAFPELI